jgi:hypothetical protein
VGGLREIPSTLRRTNRNPAIEIKTEYPSDWGRIDLSYLKYNSPDIEFCPLDDSLGTKQVELQVETMPNDQ